MSEILAEVFIPGRPRPKGSLKCQGANHHMEEDNPESKPWRRKMAAALVADRDRRWPARPIDAAPHAYAVDVSIVAFFDSETLRPAPISTRDGGDVDKLTRNVLDALQDSVSGSPGVLGDDSLVIGQYAEKVFTDRQGEQGIWIKVSTVAPAEVVRRRRIRNAALEAFRVALGMGEDTGF